ncbi:MAG: haloacid dehalogenase [Armatimonadetes bacterium]|nr:haloacid dehalogenase [Armatimonadota bacterium]MBS1725934.1 haloacid dehalogenase [Armatimonadota bacterium]
MINAQGWDDLRGRAKELHEAREQILVLCRKLGQLSSKSIRHVHRHQFVESQALLDEASATAKEVRKLMEPYPEISLSYLHDSEKEMVEAACVMAIVQARDLPSQSELGSQTMAYLHGAAEAASEVRRFALDEIRKGRMDEAERIMEYMDAIYEELVTFDFPDSLTNGLRRTVDALRAVLERTRSDLTITASQMQLVEELKKARS